MKTQKASPLKSHLGFWLRLVSNSVSHAFALKLEASSVTVAEWVILRELYDCPERISPMDIAQRTGLTRGAISKLMDRLLQKDFISRKSSREDRRFQFIELTAKARALVPRLAALADQNDAEFFAGLSKKEKENLIQLLQKVAAAKHIHEIPTE